MSRKATTDNKLVPLMAPGRNRTRVTYIEKLKFLKMLYL